MSGPIEPGSSDAGLTPRKRRGSRWIRRLGIAALLLVAFAGATTWFLLGTQSGAQFLFQRLGGLVPGSLEVGSLTGPIRGPLVIEDLHWAREGMEVHIDRVRLEWRLRALARRQLDVQSLEAEGVAVQLAPSAEDADEPIALPDVNLPVNVLVRQASVQGVVISSGGAEVADIRSIALQTRAVGDLVEIEQFVVDSDDLELDVAGRLTPLGEYPVDLEVQWAITLPLDPEAPAGTPEAARNSSTGAADATDAPSAAMRIAGGGTLSGTLERLQVRQTLRAPLEAGVEATLLTPLRDLSFDARLTLPSTSLAQITALTSSADGEGLAVEEPVEGTLMGELRAQGTLEALRADLDLVLEAADLGVGRVRIDGGLQRQLQAQRRSDSGPTQILRFDGLRVRATEGAAVLRVGGTAEVPSDEAPRFDVELAWSDLVWPLVGEPQARSSSGSADLQGTLDDYDLMVAAALLLPALPEGTQSLGDLQLRAQGNTQQLRIASLRLAPLGGEAQASGTVEFSPQVAWQLSVEGSGLDPTPLLPAGPATGAAGPGTAADSSAAGVAFVLRSVGRMEEDGPRGGVDLERLAGSVRDAPLVAAGGIRLDGERVEVEQFEVFWGREDLPSGSVGSVGGLALRATGQLTPALDLAYELEVDDLGLLVPDASGRFAARGELVGETATPRITAAGFAAELRSAAAAFERLDFEADLDLSPGGELELAARATGLRAAEVDLAQARLDLAGQRERHELRLSAVSSPLVAAASEAWSADLLVRGGLEVEGQDFATSQWEGELESLAIESGLLDGWSLSSPAALTASAQRVLLDRTCFARAAAKVCLEAAWVASIEAGEVDALAGKRDATAADGVAPANDSAETGRTPSATAATWNASTELTAVPLALLAPLLPPDTVLSGTVSGSVEAVSDAGGVAASGSLQPGPGELRYLDAQGAAQAVRFGRGDLGLTVDDRGTRAALELPLPELGRLAGEFALEGYRLAGAPPPEQALAGAVRIEISDLSFVQSLSEEITDTAGRIDADVTLGGTIGGPALRGEASLSDGRAHIPALGITLTDAQLTARGAEAGASQSPLQVEGSLTSGEGTLRINGIVPLETTGDDPAVVSVTGQRFLAMNTREVELMASPDLEIRFDGERVAVTGEVLVPEADIEIDQPPTSAVEPSLDVVFVGTQRQPVETATELPFDLRIRVILGDEVEIAALGLLAEPKGSLLLVEEAGQPTIATGEIDVSGGSFKAYGQDLTIERGRLFFSGPVDTPRIDLRAYRQANDGVIAGLEARGSLERPEITLWSEPPMGQADQLSYILLGRPIDGASQSEGNLVAKAASSLGLRGGNLLVERLAARFGLEEARIESDGGLEEASLVLGKYLTPRLYVAYGVGLFEAANSMRLRYLLSSKWTLEATTGVASGADLLYTIERGRGAKRRVPPVSEVEVPEGPDGAPGAKEQPP